MSTAKVPLGIGKYDERGNPRIEFHLHGVKHDPPGPQVNGIIDRDSRVTVRGKRGPGCQISQRLKMVFNLPQSGFKKMFFIGLAYS